MEKSAIISECGKYRYRLERKWVGLKTCLFIMLNPSTADADIDDPTIRRCMGFASREGCGRLIVVNLYGFRSTDPKALPKLGAMNAAGMKNAYHVEMAMKESDLIIAGWGRQSPWIQPIASVRTCANNFGKIIQCLGLNNNGSPRHPLYIRADAPLQAWCI